MSNLIPGIFGKINIILCNTSHSGNIGSAARSMKTMNVKNLILVAPIVLPDDHSIALASNAADVVENVRILDSLDDAIKDSTLVIGLTARRREFSQKLQTPKEIVGEIFEALERNEKVSFVFGAEKTGLSIAQLTKCNRLVTIPGNPEYFSLNLAQAVQIICYELYSTYNPNLSHLKNTANLATNADNVGVVNHLNQILEKLDWFKHKNIERTKNNLQRIIYKANLEREEVDLLRGILHTIERNMKL